MMSVHRTIPTVEAEGLQMVSYWMVLTFHN
jgi:hypothetical protein